MQYKEELCSILESEAGVESVEEDANSAVEEWKRASENQKVEKIDRETENIRDDVLNSFETACSDFVSQLENLDENVDVEEIYKVYIIHIFRGFTWYYCAAIDEQGAFFWSLLVDCYRCVCIFYDIDKFDQR